MSFLRNIIQWYRARAGPPPAPFTIGGLLVEPTLPSKMQPDQLPSLNIEEPTSNFAEPTIQSEFRMDFEECHQGDKPPSSTARTIKNDKNYPINVAPHSVAQDKIEELRLQVRMLKAAALEHDNTVLNIKKHCDDEVRCLKQKHKAQEATDLDNIIRLEAENMSMKKINGKLLEKLEISSAKASRALKIMTAMSDEKKKYIGDIAYLSAIASSMQTSRASGKSSEKCITRPTPHPNNFLKYDSYDDDIEPGGPVFF